MSSQYDQSTILAIKRSAFNLIARRDHSRQELLVKLTQKHGQQACIEAVLDELVAHGMLNETVFVENFIRGKLNKGQGPLKISAQLRAKGINQETITQYLKPGDNEFWIDQGRAALDKSSWRFTRTTDSQSNSRNDAKKQRFLQQRGFSGEQINRIVTTKPIDGDGW